MANYTCSKEQHDAAVEKATKYYPKLWNDGILEVLKANGILDDEDINTIKANANA